MKSFIGLFSLAALALAASPAHAVLSVAPGDLLLGFFQVNAGGTAAVGNTYVYNLGSASTYREGGAASSIDNINADLTTTFGAGWASDSTVRFGIVGVVGASDALTNGDPARTTYLSSPFSATAGDSSSFNLSSSQRGTLSTNLKTFFNASNGLAENGAVDGGAIYGAGNPSSFASFLPPTQTTSFGIGQNPIGSPGSVAGFDIYRTLHTLTNADLTAAYSPTPATVGSGQYIGSFTLGSNGDINFVPEPSAAVLAGIGTLALFRRRRSA